MWGIDGSLSLLLIPAVWIFLIVSVVFVVGHLLLRSRDSDEESGE